MDSIAVQLLIGVAWVVVLTAVLYFGSRLLAHWVVVSRPTGRFRRVLSNCTDIAGAARNGK